MMNSHQTDTAYTSVGGTGNVTGTSTRSSRPKTRSRLHDFRPIPLRLPFLFSFVALSAAYIVLIEILLHYAKGLPVTSTENTSELRHAQRLFKRQTSSHLSTSTVYVTSYASPATVTVSVTVYGYTTIYPNTYTGNDRTTVTLSSAITGSTVPTTSWVPTTSASPTHSPSSTRTVGLPSVTSGQTSYYVITNTIVATLPPVTVTITVKTLQTVLIFSQPTSSKSSSSTSINPISSQMVSPSIPVTQNSVVPSSQALVPTSSPTVRPPLSSETKATSWLPSSSVLNFMSPSTTQRSSSLSLSTSISLYSTAPSYTHILDSITALTFTSTSTSTSTERYSTLTGAVSQIYDSTIILNFMSSSTTKASSLPFSTSMYSSPKPLATSVVLTVSLPSTKAINFFSPTSLASPYSSGLYYTNSASCSQAYCISNGPMQTLPGSFKVTRSSLQATPGISVLQYNSSGLSSSRTGNASSDRVSAATASIPTMSALVFKPSASAPLAAPQTNVASRTVSASIIYSTSTSSIPAQSALTTGSPSTMSSNTTSASTPPPAPTFVLATTERLVQGTFNMGYYVTALYMPALLAIIIKGLWEVVFASTRLMQPFERMATQKGVSGRYSMFAQYLSSSLSWDVIRAIGHGNPIPLLAELSYILVQIGTPIAAIATTIKPRAQCQAGSIWVPCDPVWVIDVPLLRVIEGILGVCLLCIFVILFMRARHRSGVDSDPSSLGSIATISNEENLLASMQACAIDNEPVLFEQLLRRQHFRLTEYSDKTGRPRYGIISVRGPTEILSKLNQIQAYPGYHTVSGPGLPSLDSPALMSVPRSPLIPPTREAILLDTLGLLAPVTLLAIIVSFWMDGNLDDVWNRFFLTDWVWPKLLLVGLATASSILVTNIERIVRITEPFRRLNANSRTERVAPPATTLLLSRSGTAYSTLFQCIKLLIRYEHRGGRMAFQLLVALTVVASDLNIVAVAGIAWTQATTQTSFQLSMIISMALTSFVILVWLIVIFWWRRHFAVQVLRASSGAGNVAGTMRYLSCGSKEIVGQVARMYEEWYNLGSRSRDAGQWYQYQAVFGQHLCDDEKVRWCVSLQTHKTVQDIDEIQDAESQDPRLRYH